MSRKSRRAKGRRKYKNVKSKPMTKAEIVKMIIYTVIIVVVVAGFIVVPDWIEDTKNHVVGVNRDGIVKGMEDNWLVIDLGSSSSHKYSHLANIDPAEGYSFKNTDYLTDENVRMMYFSSDEDSSMEYIVMGAKNSYDVQAETFMNNQGAIFAEIYDASDLIREEVSGVNTAGFWANGTINIVYDSDGNPIEPEYDEEGNPVYPQKYGFAGYCYVESPVDNHSVLISMTLYNEESNDFPDAQTVMDTLYSAAAGIHFQY